MQEFTAIFTVIIFCFGFWLSWCIKEPTIAVSKVPVLYTIEKEVLYCPLPGVKDV